MHLDSRTAPAATRPMNPANGACCGLGLARPRADVVEACLGSGAKRRRSFRVV
jgi:hypothetical protein